MLSANQNVEIFVCILLFFIIIIIALKAYESSTLQPRFDPKLIGIPMDYRNGVFIC